MTSLAHLVSSVVVARQNALDHALTNVRAYSNALQAEAELSDTSPERRDWLRATSAALEALWLSLDKVRWDYGPQNASQRANREP